MKKKLLLILLNKYIISLIVTLLVIAFLPDFFSKYKIELAKRDTLSREGFRVYFEDLNNDSNSEKIICYNNNLGNASFEIHGSEGGLIDQWNFSKELNSGLAILFFFDANENGFNEIYLFTQRRDSIFLNISEPFVEQGIEKSDIFIDVIKEFNNEYKSGVITLYLGNKRDNNIKDVYFNINAGFSGDLRNVYKYNFNTDKIFKSPHLTNALIIKSIFDINGDGLDEVLLGGYANCNEIDSVYSTRSDYSSWLTVLDSNLDFLFEPVEIEVPFSRVVPLIYKQEKEYKLLTLIDSRSNTNNLDKIGIYSIQGELEKTIEIPFGTYRKIQFYNNNNILLHNSDIGKVNILNSHFEEINRVDLINAWELKSIDIDTDGKEEWVNISKDYQNIAIYRNDFTHPISFEIPKSSLDQLSIGLIQNESIKNGIYFQKGNEYFVYRFFKNPIYYLEYLIYIGIYLVILGLVWLIIKGQNLRTERKKAIENEIAQLQIKTIKNQVDPHFVFNAINTISEMTLTGDKLAADDFICKFSDLMRKTLQGSDKISHTLQEELDYVETFIQLQQIRFDHIFKYELNIDKNVNLEMNVPKHILYCYVENAIKHGLSKVAKKGILKIDLIKLNGKTKLSVENNGGGINNDQDKRNYSTGNGILIMERMYELYEKLYKKKVSYNLSEVQNKTGEKIGVKIDILI